MNTVEDSKLDTVFAEEVVDNRENGTTGPFETAQGYLFRGQVIPVTAGWFGEIGEDFATIIKTIAREAASDECGMTISPLINLDRKGGAFAIMLQQFRRAIGVAIIRGQVNHKLAQLHFVWATREEAAATYRANHSNNKWKPG